MKLETLSRSRLGGRGIPLQIYYGTENIEVQNQFSVCVCHFGGCGFVDRIFHFFRAGDQGILTRARLSSNIILFSMLGASSEAGIPDPIPNSAVKRFSVDGSRKARVDQCQLL